MRHSQEQARHRCALCQQNNGVLSLATFSYLQPAEGMVLGKKAGGQVFERVCYWLGACHFSKRKALEVAVTLRKFEAKGKWHRLFESTGAGTQMSTAFEKIGSRQRSPKVVSKHDYRKYCHPIMLDQNIWWIEVALCVVRIFFALLSANFFTYPNRPIRMPNARFACWDLSST